MEQYILSKIEKLKSQIGTASIGDKISICTEISYLYKLLGEYQKETAQKEMFDIHQLTKKLTGS